uniref:(northern house mosquito) hypothetical protein n=1 Tax=Culex pipiens TaxID=7175 RepID=A0A8D8EY65_CULPI
MQRMRSYLRPANAPGGTHALAQSRAHLLLQALPGRVQKPNQLASTREKCPPRAEAVHLRGMWQMFCPKSTTSPAPRSAPGASDHSVRTLRHEVQNRIPATSAPENVAHK